MNADIKDTRTKKVPTEKHNNSTNEVALRFLSPFLHHRRENVSRQNQLILGKQTAVKNRLLTWQNRRCQRESLSNNQRFQ